MTSVDLAERHERSEAHDLVKMWIEARDAKQQWEARYKELSALLAEGIPDDVTRLDLDGEYVCTVSHITRETFNKKAFDHDYPGLRQQYTTLGTPYTQLSRRQAL